MRSLIFKIGFYIGSALILVIGSPLLFGKRSWAMAGLALHGKFVLWWLELTVGTKIEVRGLKNLPDNPVLIAAKHQAPWETFALPTILKDPALIMKEELMAIPFYGWFSRKFKMIPIRRERAAIALKEMLREAETRKQDNREIIIFPEGTRQIPGAEPNYKPGVIKLYESLNIPCVPVALNSGVFWPRNEKKLYKGTIIIEFLPPIPPGLERKIFKETLINTIEEKCKELQKEGEDEKESHLNSKI
ncbi:MAG: lysophospholipid acyltransferase family protein [Hyphomicrobiales bacterium]